MPIPRKHYPKEQISKVIMPKDLNSYGTLFGGQILSWMDEISVILALKVTGKECVTTNFDNVEIKKSCFVNDILDIKAEIIEMGRCYLKIKIEVYRFNKDKDNEIIAKGTSKFVALNEKKKPTRIL